MRFYEYTISAVLLILLLSITAGLGGCVGQTPQIIVRDHYLVPTVDESLRHCRDRPGRPTLTDSADEAELIARLDDRGNDCASKLGATWSSIDDARHRAEVLNRANER